MAMNTPEVPHRRRSLGSHQLQPETLMMGYGHDPALAKGALKCPLYQTSSFAFRTAEEAKAFFELAYGLREKEADEEPGLVYSRVNNPDLQLLEERLALWENAEGALVFSSGMAAITGTLLTFLRPGETLLWGDPVYGGTEFFIENVLPSLGITTVGFTDHRDGRLQQQALDAAGGGARIAAIYVETPTSPSNRLIDIATCADTARKLGEATGRKPLVIVDNTFLGPLWQQPLALGADFSLYSLSKCITGHGDLVAGACLGGREHLAQLRSMRTVLGSIADPHTAWLALRSLETLKLRMTAAMKNAQLIADFLGDHPRVTRVHHLAFVKRGDPQYEVFRRQCKAAGSAFAFEIQGGEPEAFQLLNRLQIVKLAIGFGGTESVIEHPATMSLADLTPERQHELGVTPAMLRLSVGIEHPDDLVADLRQALEDV
jgi:methionine-gamma-lyase